MVQVNILRKNDWQDVALKLECKVTTFLPFSSQIVDIKRLANTGAKGSQTFLFLFGLTEASLGCCVKTDKKLAVLFSQK